MRKIFTLTLLLTAASFFTLTASAQMDFVQNKGQWHENVLYRGDFKTGSFFLEKNGFTVLMHKPEDLASMSEAIHGHAPKGKTGNASKGVLHSFAYKMKFLGASPDVSQVPEKQLTSYNNYFIGNDPSKWANECRIYHAITYKNVYPNIDVRFYTEGNSLKYDFIIHPGGNPSMIAMQYDGPPDVTIKNRELIITTPVGEIKELYPYSYQLVGGKKMQVDNKYVVKNKVVTFSIKDYDQKSVLVIDPSIVFSTFTGAQDDNWGYTATPGPDGTFFAGGIVFGGRYPVSPGAFQQNYGGGFEEDQFDGYDMAIFKFSANGSARVYATFLGGSKNEQPHSMITDAQGNLIIAGRTSSENYPVTVPLHGPGGGYDIVVTKLNAAGSALVGSMKIGGAGNDGVNIRPKWALPRGTDKIRRNYGDDARSEVILGAGNEIFVASCTQSNDFPITGTSPVQLLFGGGRQDGVILKLNASSSAVLFSTYFGGSGDDACFVGSINPVTGNLFIAGGTTSNNLPGSRVGVMTPTYQGGDTDGFVTELTPTGSAILRTTYQGTSGADIVYGLKFDRAGFPYVMGTTTGSWPVINAAFSNPGSKQFISKLQPDFSGYVYSTIFGTNSPVPNISPIAFLVDRCENVYVSGWGGGLNIEVNYNPGSTAGMPEVSPLTGIPGADGADFYFFVLRKNAASQLFGSHYGQFGGTGDHVDGGTSRFDPNGVIYQGICANCDGNAVFPTTPGSWSVFNGSAACNQVALKIEMNFAGVGAGLQTSINNVTNDTIGCVPLLVTFRDTLQLGKKFIWDFGDGSPPVTTTRFDTSHLYTTVGTFRVMLIGEDSLTCNIRDTAYITIRVGDRTAALSFIPQKLPPCESFKMRFTNTSTASSGNLQSSVFTWDYGDGSPKETGGFNPPREHTYASPGTYIVTLSLEDTLFCNSPIEYKDTIRLNALVDAIIDGPSMGCAPFTIKLGNESLAGTDYLWDFGNGDQSTEFEPTYTFQNPGTYNVTLTVTDTGTCNRVDTDVLTIQIFPQPTASFSISPLPPRENTPTTFTNLSSPDAVRFKWFFGDGDSSEERSPVHQYNATGNYEAMLIAYNAAGCPDTARLPLSAIVIPLLDVPNAFTPGQFGVNSHVSVAGFGIDRMDWKIYNRWGQLMYRSVSRKQPGWDGTYKGKLQPMDVYSYTLDVQFTDGQKLRKTGDITLLR